MATPGTLETTPLLAGHARQLERSGDDVTGHAHLPAIRPTLTLLQRDGIPPDDTWCPSELSHIQRTAFKIIVLARIRAALTEPSRRPPDDLWEQWEHGLTVAQTSAEAEKRMQQLWTTFVRQPCTPTEISALFWQEYPLEEGKYPVVRGTLATVIRVICSYKSPFSC